MTTKELIKRLNDQYKNIKSINRGEYWKCKICNEENIDFSLVREHHIEHELDKILDEFAEKIKFELSYNNLIIDGEYTKTNIIINKILKELKEK